MAQFQFDATQHASVMNFDALPKGWYQAVLIESKARTTSSGGQALDFTAEITAPPFAKGRKVFLGYNVVNSNPEAVRIGFEQLAALSLACGHPRWNQTEELHNKPFHIKLKIEKAPEGSDYEDRNQPNGYDPISVQRALAVQPGAAPGAAATPAAPFPGAVPAAPAAPAAPSAPVPPSAPMAPAPSAPAAPVAPAAAPAQPWTQPAAAPTQPWEQPAAAAPVAPAAPAAPAPWQTQTATPAPQQPAPNAAPAAPAEPPHPAQAAVPPWQQPTA